MPVNGSAGKNSEVISRLLGVLRLFSLLIVLTRRRVIVPFALPVAQIQVRLRRPSIFVLLVRRERLDVPGPLLKTLGDFDEV
jgi:hypothetical protein